MKCRNVQRVLDELSSGRLPDPQAREVRQHLADCTDCRVQQQRAAKLQRLLALKRYEQPAPAYFDNFLTEFHARLEEEQARVGFWRRLFVAADLEPLLTWRYGLATAACLLGALGLVWFDLARSPENSPPAAQAPLVEPVTVVVRSSNPVPPVGETALVTPGLGLPLPPETEIEPTISTGRPALAPAVAPHDSAPRYVLDRIMPVTYEVSNVDF